MTEPVIYTDDGLMYSEAVRCRCGLPLEPWPDGPCQECGRSFDVTSIDYSHFEAYGHAYVEPKRCPVHGVSEEAAP